ncbi:hypothetical protein K402DRAFT_394963 [Aulographum hederae CBS 113979]|uniref:Uncharacterized protein n=1 Tax=Aulographum hederae CBS 113979 TaxID=1176131 RepID=A0A6G1GWC9_9PEZI|nr:hypothetical protein K402DRAFT_394963 [Aulographum hederae CBS 113979]
MEWKRSVCQNIHLTGAAKTDSWWQEQTTSQAGYGSMVAWLMVAWVYMIVADMMHAERSNPGSRRLGELEAGRVWDTASN